LGLCSSHCTTPRALAQSELLNWTGVDLGSIPRQTDYYLFCFRTRCVFFLDCCGVVFDSGTEMQAILGEAQAGGSNFGVCGGMVIRVSSPGVKNQCPVFYLLA
jgi:hypothetical protein